MTDYRQFYIDGQWVDPQQPQDCPVINPATEQRIATISLGGPADVDRAVVAARRAFEAYAHSTVAERSALIGRVLDAYRRRQDEIGAAISEEMGAPLAFARRSQAGIGAAHLATMLEVLQTFRFSEERDGMLLLREPVGVCGFITPWNWPINQIACKVLPALAAGCTMVLKPSEVAPLNAAIFAEVLDAAGSRYTYSANWLAYDEARERGLEKLALVGMGCQTSAAPVMWSRKIGKVGKPIQVTIGLLCSKTFDDRIFEELFEAKYGISRATIKKVNIKGVFQIWTHDGGYHEIPLKECHAWTREGCNHCPDFAAEHADISTGGIGKFSDWTLTVVRTELGKAIIDRMIAAGRIVTRPAEEDDPDAIKLMARLSRNSRNRWPETAIGFPKRMPPPPPKKAKAPPV